jgi:hypothetical protein
VARRAQDCLDTHSLRNLNALHHTRQFKLRPGCKLAVLPINIADFFNSVLPLVKQ